MKPSRYTRAAALIICFVLMVTAVCVPSQKAAAKTKNMTGVVTADSLNVRTGAGTGYDKLVVKECNAYLTKGQEVTILKESNGWYYIEFQFLGTKQKGYVLGDYIDTKKTSVNQKEETVPTKKETLTVKSNPLKISASIGAELLNVRDKASTDGTVKEKLKSGAKITILNELKTATGRWYKVKVQASKVTGYVHGDYVKISYGKGVKGYIQSTANVGVRKTASEKGAWVKKSGGAKLTLKPQTAITILSEKMVKNERWVKISVKSGKKTYKGYVPAANITFVKPAKAASEVKPTPTPTAVPTKKPTPKPTKVPEPTEQPEETPTPTETPTQTPTVTPTPEVTPQPGNPTVSGGELASGISSMTISTDPVAGAPVRTDLTGNIIYLSQKQPFAIYQIINVNGYSWYNVGIQINGVMYYGYILSDYVVINSEYNAYVQQWPAPSASDQNGTISPTVTPPVTSIVTPTQAPVVTQKPLTAEEFEAKMTQEGFPESYKVQLRELHKKYPLWQFQAHHTGLDWNTVIEKEQKPGSNLISNSKGVEWKSLDQGKYKWETDKFVPFDGASWVNASEAAIAYYMDPRNFMTENRIFQFEVLTYHGEYQNAQGVENILKNTPLSNTSFTYTDDFGGMRTMTYAQAFIEAAQYANVSPYHLATRVKQEVVAAGNRLSNSVTGTVSGYEGYYNFYNIGASHSTEAGGAVINGLKYAMNGSGNATLDAQSKIPWNNPYDAIVGGAYIIGRNYINRGDAVYRGQDTIYLQKFNVTNKTTYGHQYMSNVEAPYAESDKMYRGYQQPASTPIVFSIPVYKNMPESNVPYPAPQKNPNNWLKTLNVVDEYDEPVAMTPSFVIGAQGEYSMIVDSTVELVCVNAVPVSTKASIVSGTGKVLLEDGVNEIQVVVRAENGDLRIYKLTIVRQPAEE